MCNNVLRHSFYNIQKHYYLHVHSFCYLLNFYEPHISRNMPAPYHIQVPCNLRLAYNFYDFHNLYDH